MFFNIQDRLVALPIGLSLALASLLPAQTTSQQGLEFPTAEACTSADVQPAQYQSAQSQSTGCCVLKTGLRTGWHYIDGETLQTCAAHAKRAELTSRDFQFYAGKKCESVGGPRSRERRGKAIR